MLNVLTISRNLSMKPGCLSSLKETGNSLLPILSLSTATLQPPCHVSAASLHSDISPDCVQQCSIRSVIYFTSNTRDYEVYAFYVDWNNAVFIFTLMSLQSGNHTTNKKTLSSYKIRNIEVRYLFLQCFSGHVWLERNELPDISAKKKKKPESLKWN